MSRKNFFRLFKIADALSKFWRSKSLLAKLGGLGAAYKLAKGAYKAYYRVKLKPGEQLIISHKRHSSKAGNGNSPGKT